MPARSATRNNTAGSLTWMRLWMPVCVLLCVLYASNLLAAAKKPLRDPTEPPWYHHAVLPQAPQELQLSSILFSRNRQLAIINGKLLTPGDNINGATVKKITRTKVILNGFGQKITLNLTPGLLHPRQQHRTNTIKPNISPPGQI